LNRIGEFPLAQFQKSPQEGKMTITTADAPSVQTLIMAGGRGERLYPLTVSRPKPTVPFGGVFRIVDFTLSNCLNSGLTNVSLLTQYRHQELQSYIQQNWSGLWSGIALEPLECILPRSAGRYRGTADAVFQNVDKLKRPGSEMVVILSADQVYHMDYREILSRHASTQADVTIGTVERPLNAAKDFGVVEVDSDYKVVGFEEEPALPRPSSSCQARALVNMGVYVFRKEILLQVLHENCRTESEFDFAHHIIPSLIGSANVRAYDFRDRAGDLPGYWRNIDTIDDYHEANMELVRPGTQFDLFANSHWPSYPSSRYRNSSDVRSRLQTSCRVRHSILSPGVQIDDGGNVESSVLMERVCVNKNAHIRNAVVEEGVCIPAGSRIGFDLDNDRQRHFVTDAGIVVVSRSPVFNRRPTVDVTRHMESRPGVGSFV
jgi:glucose-1-phosphate adenylyltransferase